jgi:DNA polymerase-4
MDAFYASVELLRYPDLRGRPMVVGGRQSHQPQAQADGTRRYASLKDYVGRGVITTATYEARALGVHSGMGLMKAAALAPEAVLLPVDFDQYRRYSRLFKAAVAELVPVIEDRGIDEIYIDLTGVADGQDDLQSLARQIKARVRAATGLSCSIGITPNKLLSKLCSDLEKPDGLTILTETDLPARIWPLPAKRINGIGPKASEKLEGMGIHTIGELAAAGPQLLAAHFGPNYGTWLHDAAHGRDDRPVVTYSEPKSLSRETTFERDLHPRHDREALGGIFTQLCERLAADLQARHYRARSVGLKLRYDDFRIVTRDLTLPSLTDDAREIRQAAGACLKRVPLDRRLRLLGVRAGGLCRADALSAADHRVSDSEGHRGTTLPLFGPSGG